MASKSNLELRIHYLQSCIKQANAIFKSEGYAMHWDEHFIPRTERGSQLVQTSWKSDGQMAGGSK